VAQSAALAEKFHYMCYALATYGQAAVAIFHFLREGKKLCVWGWFVRTTLQNRTTTSYVDLFFFLLLFRRFPSSSFISSSIIKSPYVP
jgi:hypothetical protein